MEMQYIRLYIVIAFLTVFILILSLIVIGLKNTKTKIEIKRHISNNNYIEAKFIGRLTRYCRNIKPGKIYHIRIIEGSYLITVEVKETRDIIPYAGLDTFIENWRISQRGKL